METISIKAKIGSLLNNLPYSCLPFIGRTYNNCKSNIKEYNAMTQVEKRKAIFNNTYKIVSYAIERIPFYKEFYADRGFSISQLKSFEDIERIPVVTKKDLMAVPLEQRSLSTKGCYVANTGGSTGVPLSFYKSRAHQIKEMAYYHDAWSRFGYTKSDIRLQLVGRSKSQDIEYDITRNRLTAGVYMPLDKLLDQLSIISKNITVSFLQGYPSVLYELALYLEDNPAPFKSLGLKDSLKGVFLNSEYPYPEFRKKIEDVFGVKSLASYGHTEGCVLAFDYGNTEYEVYQSYGFAEVKSINGENHLIGTTYDNFASPFIRYDTGDIVDNAVFDEDILKSFKMTDGGRSGQYIIDKSGKKISLTGLIFGKHHELFNYCSQMQVSQSEKGFATIYYVTPKDSLKGKSPCDLFDSKEVDIDFSFERIDVPFRTKSGKVLLLI